VEIKKQLIQDYTISTDVEWFLRNKNSGEIVSAEGIIKGTKHEPFRFDENDKLFATSLDCVLAEGNCGLARTPLEFFNVIEKLRNYINSTLPQELETLAIPAAELDDKYLQTEVSRTYGCDPSLNCWTDEEVIPKPDGSRWRSAGFHIHTGYDSPNKEVNRDLARAMDLFLGIPSVLLEPTNQRKKVGYGHAGNYRHQPHGFEYRSLSSHFSSGKNLIEWCFRGSERAIAYVNSREVERIYDMGELIQQTINYEDKALAEMICKDFGIELA